MEDHRRRCTTVRQLELMVEFLESHRDLALGRVRSKEARAVSARLWSECAEILNVEGPARTGKEWAKVWNDQKCKVRSKLVSINASLQATGGGPSSAPTLSPLEERMANILGREFGPLSNVRQDQFAPIDDVNVVEENVEEDTEEVEVDMPEARNVSPIINLNEADLHPAPAVAPSPVPTSSSRVARTAAREQRRAQRASRQQSAQAQAPAQSNRTALDESRSMILQIEKMRAEADLKSAEASLINAQASLTNAQSFKLIAQSIDRFSQRYCQQQQQPEPPQPQQLNETEESEN